MQKAKILLAAVLAVLAMMATGCEAETTPATDLVVVGLQGSNTPSLSLETPAVGDAVRVAVSGEEGSSFTFILATPEAESVTVRWQEKKAKNAAFWKKEVEQRVDEVAECIAGLGSAKQEETDILESLYLAGRALKSGTAPQHKILLAHSGLNTAGLLQFQQQGIPTEEEAETLVQALEEQGALPELQGAEILWLYCGDTVSPQDKLTAAEKNNLQAFWEKLLLASGAKEVIFSSEIPTTGSVPGAPPVTVVPTAGTEAEPLLLEEGVALDPTEEGVALDPTSVAFLPDQAALKDPDQVTSYLKKYAEEMCSTEDVCYLLVGSTADVEGVSTEQLKAFSLQRAQAVRDLLTQRLNVPEEKLQVLGVGNLDTPLRSIEDQKNRSVWIVRADSALGQELLAAV